MWAAKTKNGAVRITNDLTLKEVRPKTHDHAETFALS